MDTNLEGGFGESRGTTKENRKCVKMVAKRIDLPMFKVEAIQRLDFTSGPQFRHESFIGSREVEVDGNYVKESTSLIFLILGIREETN